MASEASVVVSEASASSVGLTQFSYNAALLRGILSNVNDKNQSNWYNLYDNSCTPQYSEYSKWVRDHCAGTIANTGYPYASLTQRHADTRGHIHTHPHTHTPHGHT